MKPKNKEGKLRKKQQNKEIKPANRNKQEDKERTYGNL